MTIECDAIIVGGGPAGASLAVQLARAGCHTVLIEKEMTAHDKVCGEFISTEGLAYLRGLKIDLRGLGGVPLHEFRVASRGEAISKLLPFPALSLSRRTLDEALLEKAAQAGAVVVRGCRVSELARNERWEARAGGTLVARAPAIFLAAGKHDLRGWKRPRGWQNELVAFKCYWRLDRKQEKALEGSVELALFPGGYAGLQPVEDNRANLCLVIERRRLVALGGAWSDVLRHVASASPHLAKRLTGAEAVLDRPLAISSIPYGYVVGATDEPWRVGDQAAVIPSFSGDGMSIALHSASLAAKHFLSGKSACDYHKALRRQTRIQIARATLLSKLLVSPAGQLLAMAAIHSAPAIMIAAAKLTRIPDIETELAT